MNQYDYHFDPIGAKREERYHFGGMIGGILGLIVGLIVAIIITNI